jgi:tetratricopeptide (TPR) repeat protein
MKARQTFTDDPELAFSLGAINYRKAEYPTALRFLRQSLARRPQHAETLFFLGMSLFQMKNGPESRAHLMEAIQRKLPPQEEHEARRVLDELNRQG